MPTEPLQYFRTIGQGGEGRADLHTGSITGEALILLGALRGMRGHPNIIKAYDFWHLEFDPKWARIQLEYCEEGDLYQLIRRFHVEHEEYPREFLLWHILLQLSVGIIYLHTGARWNYTTRQMTPGPTNWNQVVHRDLTPGNIFVRHRKSTGDSFPMPDVVIGDFGFGSTDREVPGFAGLIRQSYRGAGYATPGYLPPEYFVGPLNGIDQTKLDIWQVGAAVYQLATGQLASGVRGWANWRYSNELYEVLKVFLISSPEHRMGDEHLEGCIRVIHLERDKLARVEKRMQDWTFDLMRYNVGRI